jgi:hypothetical protein
MKPRTNKEIVRIWVWVLKPPFSPAYLTYLKDGFVWRQGRFKVRVQELFVAHAMHYEPR